MTTTQSYFVGAILAKGNVSPLPPPICSLEKRTKVFSRKVTYILLNILNETPTFWEMKRERTSNDIILGNGRKRFMVAIKFNESIFSFFKVLLKFSF